MSKKSKRPRKNKSTSVSKADKLARAKLTHEERIWLKGALQHAAMLLQQSKLPEAGQLYDQIVHKDPANVEALEQLGLIMTKSGNAVAAEQLFRRACDLDPTRVRSHYMLACVLSGMNQESAAIDLYLHCLKLKPDLIEAHNNLGVIYKSREQFELAVKSFNAVVKHQPNSAYALSNLGNVLKDAGLMARAVETLEKAVAAEPQLTSAYSNLLVSLNYLSKLSSADIYQRHRDWFSHVPGHIKPNRFDFSARTTTAKTKLRIGFVSPDLHIHSVAYFMAPLFSGYDRTQFEMIAYYNNNRSDPVQKQFAEWVDEWHPVMQLDELTLADKVYADAIDILIDLAGHTANNRLAVFYQKPAPVQMTWLGYPNTTGLDQIDYRISDQVADPEGSAETFNSEKLLRLPGSFICYDPMLSDAEKAQLRVRNEPRQGRAAFTFASFNNLVKVTDQVVEAWASILLQVKHARLLVKSRQLGNDMTRARLLKRFEAFGIAEDRLVMRAMVPDRLAHMKLYEDVDLALDPFPYNGTTTTCEALWMGVPTLTLEGAMHAGRVGASLMRGLGLDDFVATSRKDYVDKAVALAANTDSLHALQVGLRARMEAAPLGDSARFVESFQSLLSETWKRFSDAQG